MLDGWLADKPVIPGSKAIAAICGRPTKGEMIDMRPPTVPEISLARYQLVDIMFPGP
jgi:hypothetical protein